MPEKSVVERIKSMLDSPKSRDHDHLWTDVSELGELLAVLERTKHKDYRQRYACHTALYALATNSQAPEVVQAIIDVVGKTKTKQDKESLLMGIQFLPSYANADPILELVNDKKVGYTAIGALSTTSDPRAEAAVIKALEKGTFAFPAAETLAKIGTVAAIPALLRAIENGNNFLKRAALNALRRIDGANHVELFIKIYEAERNADVRWHCIAALRDHGSLEHVGIVAERLAKIAKKKGRKEEYAGGPLIAPKNIVHISHRSDEEYATEFTLGVEFIKRVGGDEADKFFKTLEKFKDRLFESERKLLIHLGLLQK